MESGDNVRRRLTRTAFSYPNIKQQSLLSTSGERKTPQEFICQRRRCRFTAVPADDLLTPPPHTYTHTHVHPAQSINARRQYVLKILTWPFDPDPVFRHRPDRTLWVGAAEEPTSSPWHTLLGHINSHATEITNETWPMATSLDGQWGNDPNKEGSLWMNRPGRTPQEEQPSGFTSFFFFFWGPTEGFYLLTCEGSAGSCKTPTVWTYIGLSSIIQHLAHCGWTTEVSVCVWVCVCFHCSESTLVRFFQKITQYLRMTFCCFMSAVFDGNLFYDLTSAPLLNSWRVPELKWQVFASL